MSSRFIWNGIAKDVRHWTRTYPKYQASNVTHHTISPPGTFLPVSIRLEHVHTDISGGFKYILTCVDRFTRCSKVTPFTDISKDAVAKAFITTWISRFGTPLSLPSDRGSQFESTLWNKIISLLGIRCSRTASYHGLVERFH
ncbi:uncharacterized protein LOC143038972 [Oratosquilla oratoria]|uniref:uncharacterized protein LOC143038972 n=1 Tax=Oratosquilla oratoria TaxID=337810 RepID=UPI003F75FC08